MEVRDWKHWGKFVITGLKLEGPPGEEWDGFWELGGAPNLQPGWNQGGKESDSANNLNECGRAPDETTAQARTLITTL